MIAPLTGGLAHGRLRAHCVVTPGNGVVGSAQFDAHARGGDVEVGRVSVPGGLAGGGWIGARP
jgi:hypothetical protein